MSQESLEQQQSFVQTLRAALRASEALDDATAARLAQARGRAVAAAKTPQRSSVTWLLLPAVMATAVLVLTLALRHSAPMTHDAPELRAANTLELLTDDKDPQFYRDLEFYKWLAQQPQRRA